MVDVWQPRPAAWGLWGVGLVGGLFGVGGGVGACTSVQPGDRASACGGCGVCEGDCSVGRRAGGVGLPLGGPDFFAPVQVGVALGAFVGMRVASRLGRDN